MLFSRGTGIDLVHRFFHIRRVVHSKEKGDGHSTARKRILRKLASHRITPHCRENKDQVTRSKSQNRSFEPHPIVRRTLRYRQTVRLIRTHDSGGKGTRGDEERERERERESGGAIVVDRCCNEIQRKRVACSLLEPKRFKAKRSAEPWTFLPLWRKRNSNERCSRVVTWAQGRKVNVFCEASCKPEASREKVGFRIRAGWWSSSLCLRAQAELRPSCSVSFPPHLLLSSSVIPRPSSDPASRSLGEFLSLSVARLARWRQPRAMASNLSRNFPIYSRLLDSIRRDSDRDIPPTNASLSVYQSSTKNALSSSTFVTSWKIYIYISIPFSR